MGARIVELAHEKRGSISVETVRGEESGDITICSFGHSIRIVKVERARGF